MQQFINKLSSARRPSALRALTALILNGPKDLISLATGMPNTGLFPFDSAEFKLKDGKSIHIDEATMRVALQYGSSIGYGPLVDWMKAFQFSIHGRKTEHLMITNGSQDGLAKAFEMLIETGDDVLVETPTYPGVLAIVKPMPCRLVGVQSDHIGIIPESLIEAIGKCERPPKILYLSPTGANPSGACASIERKQTIYNIANRHNLIILEDDPYYFMQFGAGLSLTPSYYSLDESCGRVLRFDSFSKLLSSGMRVGVVSGHKDLLERLELHMQASNLHPSNLSQVVLFKLLEEWQYERYMEHITTVAKFYESRRDTFCSYVDSSLSEYLEYEKPRAGMFLWLRCRDTSVDTTELIAKRALAEKVVLVPGNVFNLDETLPSGHMRAAYSIASDEEMKVACDRLRSLFQSL